LNRELKSLSNPLQRSQINNFSRELNKGFSKDLIYSL
jgi:hypothetical protein